MTKDILPFGFEGSEVRVVSIGDEPWWVASDVARCLDYAKTQSLTDILDDDEKGYAIVVTLGGEQELMVINESGLYHACFKSRKDVAVRFRKWITSEVIPSLRRVGKYEVKSEPIALPATLADINASLTHIDRLSGAGDIQLAQLLKLLVANEALKQTQNSPLLKSAIEQPMQLEGAVDVAIRMGYSVSKNNEGRLGSFVRKACSALVQGKNQRYSQASGKQVPANMYPANHPDVEAAVRAFFS